MNKYKTTYTYKRYGQWFIDNLYTYTNDELFIKILIGVKEKGINIIILETEKIGNY